MATFCNWYEHIMVILKDQLHYIKDITIEAVCKKLSERCQSNLANIVLNNSVIKNWTKDIYLHHMAFWST
jgi:hypothetical protein